MSADPVLQQVQTLLDAGRIAEAARSLAAAARRGQVGPMLALAHWSIAGNIVPRNLPAARELLGKAGAAGDADGAMLHASFLASGTGGEPDWPAALASLKAWVKREPRARAQLDMIGRMAIDDRGYPAGSLDTRRLSADGRVRLCERFATADECRYLHALGGPFLQPSLVADPTSGRMIPHPVRRSDGAMFGVHLEDLVVGAINRRFASVTGTRTNQGEPLQLLSYSPGGEYRPHMDALPNEPNQRIMTAILYLNDGYGGGETLFPRLGVTLRAKAGDALIFENLTADGRADPAMIHAGAPVTSGVKAIATRWIRRDVFRYPPPRPLLAALPQ